MNRQELQAALDANKKQIADQESYIKFTKRNMANSQATIDALEMTNKIIEEKLKEIGQ